MLGDEILLDARTEKQAVKICNQLNEILDKIGEKAKIIVK